VKVDTEFGPLYFPLPDGWALRHEPYRHMVFVEKSPWTISFVYSGYENGVFLNHDVLVQKPGYGRQWNAQRVVAELVEGWHRS
jgi:hypothetical protein